MQIKSEQLASQLEKTLKPVYAIHGDEALLVLEAVDATCSRIMGIDPNKVVYLNAPDCPHYNDEASITQTGESPRSVRTDFQLIKDFADLRLA